MGQTNTVPRRIDGVEGAAGQVKKSGGPGVTEYWSEPYGEGARVYNSADIAIPNNVITALTFDSERFDTDNIHDAGDPSRLTCRTAGKYLITACVYWAHHIQGVREVGFMFNGGGQGIAWNSANAPNAVPLLHKRAQSCTTIYELAVGEYVECFVWQTSGGNLNVEAALLFSPEFAMQRIG